MKTRREFLKGVAGATAAVFCGVSLTSILQGCTNVKRIQSPIVGNTIVVDKSEFFETDFVVINNSKLLAPIYLIKESDSSYRALLMYCTHKGCELRPTGSFLTCPCHGSEFSNKGIVLQGPADKSLTEYKTINFDTKISIELNTGIRS